MPALEIVRLVREPGTENTSDGHVLRVLYRTIRAAFVLGIAYAIYQAVGGERFVAGVHGYGAPRLRTDPVSLTGLGLLLGVVAALLLAFLPPPHFSRRKVPRG